MKTVKVRITLELESADKDSVYSYVQSLIEDGNLDYDIVNDRLASQETLEKRHPLADF